MEDADTPHWEIEHAIETPAAPETLGELFRDVEGWKRWNAGIEWIELHGPFAAGTEFSMKPPDHEPLRSVLREVRENHGFLDETRVGELRVFVDHRIERISEDRTRVTYSLEAFGPGAEEIGPAIAADFPDVLKALVQLAEHGCAIPRG